MAELNSLIKRGSNYINKIRDSSFISSLEKTSSMFLISQFLSKRIKDVEKFRFIILTNKLIKTRSDQIETPIINNIKSEDDIWDLDRIKRLYEGRNTQEDIIIETLAAEGFSAVSGDGMTVGLSLELNDDLIQEGIVRDLVRQVQNVRKDAGFSVEDRINIHWELNSEFQEAVSKFEKYFCNETLTTSISNSTNVEGFKAEFQIKEKLIKIVVKVADK